MQEPFFEHNLMKSCEEYLRIPRELLQIDYLMCFKVIALGDN